MMNSSATTTPRHRPVSIPMRQQQGLSRRHKTTQKTMELPKERPAVLRFPELREETRRKEPNAAPWLGLREHGAKNNSRSNRRRSKPMPQKRRNSRTWTTSSAPCRLVSTLADIQFVDFTLRMIRIYEKTFSKLTVTNRL